MLSPAEVEEERSVRHLGLFALIPGGQALITHVCKTIPMRVWQVTTEGHQLRAAGKHRVASASGLLAVDQLRIGDFLHTVDGLQKVISVACSDDVENLFDIRVESDDHLYYSGGILSHNSTGIGSAEWLRQNLLHNYSWMYLAPMQHHVKTFTDRLEALQRVSPYTKAWLLSKGLRSNFNFKETPMGGTFKAEHVLTDPTKIRGNTARKVVVDEAQNFDPEFLPEIAQVQKAYGRLKGTTFTGTALSLDTCLQAKYDESSQGVWHVKCDCPMKWHPMDDKEAIFAMMSVEGLKCPQTNRLLDPMRGRFVHGNDAAYRMNRPGFHVPQVIVPAYATGDEWLDIWKDFKEYKPEKFLREVMGISTDAGQTELTENDLKNCCGSHTFAQIQAEVLSGKRTYRYLFSGCDWGGSDWQAATKSKLSYTVHTIYGLNPDGILELIYAHRYAEAHYKEIAGLIAHQHKKYKAYAMGTDEGGGSYYNAHIRDEGGIPANRIVSFKYGDPLDFLHLIEHPYWLMMSLHRTDSISALYEDVKDRKFLFPAWGDCKGFLLDFLNCRRNFTETNTGRSVMRFMKHGAKADDFMMSSNYATMMKRITLNESTIPNAQFLREINSIISGNSTNGFNGFSLGSSFSG